jgi:hypothetical protein
MVFIEYKGYEICPQIFTSCTNNLGYTGHIKFFQSGLGTQMLQVNVLKSDNPSILSLLYAL